MRDGEQELFRYSGAVSASIVAATAESLRARLMSLDVEAPRARKIFSSFVELAYNIIHHGEPEGVRDVRIVRCGSIDVWQHADSYHLRSRSLISASNASPLAERLSELRGLTPQQLRSQFRAQLASLKHLPETSSVGGAGLGLLTVARNAAQPIEFALDAAPAHEGKLQLQIHTVIQ
ncbi:SiaB family protein kinase [Steroidobacter sp.]|uniref:SiaB family protein kinase n=1 Tax=Steroidobacter sp. TaxID=1978227 RepID=UPI001A4092E6|nr:SiaB family protein kinase [Steroidobacter sp.]MBL8267489.1 SiaB family protein kinase [Steroidobacter sp.]